MMSCRVTRARPALYSVFNLISLLPADLSYVLYIFFIRQLVFMHAVMQLFSIVWEMPPVMRVLSSRYVHHLMLLAATAHHEV